MVIVRIFFATFEQFAITEYSLLVSKECFLLVLYSLNYMILHFLLCKAGRPFKSDL